MTSTLLSCDHHMIPSLNLWESAVQCLAVLDALLSLATYRWVGLPIGGRGYLQMGGATFATAVLQFRGQPGVLNYQMLFPTISTAQVCLLKARIKCATYMYRPVCFAALTVLARCVALRSCRAPPPSWRSALEDIPASHRPSLGMTSFPMMSSSMPGNPPVAGCVWW